MLKKPYIAETSAGLRRRAERRAGRPNATSAVPHSEIDTRRMLHELEVHQIELEMQNTELRIARDEAEALLEKYTDLYDFAPVGYFTLAADGTIRLVNLTGSMLVAVERSKLKDRSIAMLFAPDQRAGLRAFFKQVFAGDASQSADFELISGDRPPRIVNIEAQRSPDGLECNVTMVDITERKRTEDQVNCSEIRYRRLFEATHDGVLLLDPATCKITDANPHMSRLLGYPRDHLLGKELFEIGLLKDEAASRDMFRNLKRDHEVRYEDLPLATQRGRQQEVEVVANLYQENGHSVIQCNIRDITARKHAEEVSLRNQVLFSALIEQAPVGVYVIDAEFRLQQVNPTALQAFANIHPLIGRDFAEVVRILWPRRIANELIARFRHTLQTGETFQAPAFEERRRDTRVRESYEWQTQRVILPAGEYGVVCFFNNITEQVAEEAARQRLEKLTASNQRLKQEIVRRQAVEENLRTTRQQQCQLLRQSRRQQKKLRDFSHRILQTQEEERKRISRELHDVIAQTLVGINVHLTALSNGAAADPDSLLEQVHNTHMQMEKAVERVHDFCRELRPIMLDDLGLLPALQTFMKDFMEETGIRVNLNAVGVIEKSPDEVRTALYRVAQEALNNVARHAKASRVEVCIESLDGIVRMQVKDDGQGFDADSTSDSKKTRRLGVQGMRERIEMIGGKFRVESKKGQPTTVIVEIPAKKSGRKIPHANPSADSPAPE